MGKILWIDLSRNKISEEKLEEKMCRDYIGGYGLGARILFERMKAGADPLGPENILGFVNEPLYRNSGSGRFKVCSDGQVTADRDLGRR